MGFVLTEFRPSELVENVSDTFPVLSRLFRPDWSIVGAVVEKMVETIFLALMASALALPFAFGLSFLGARNVDDEDRVRVGWSTSSRACS